MGWNIQDNDNNIICENGWDGINDHTRLTDGTYSKTCNLEQNKNYTLNCIDFINNYDGNRNNNGNRLFFINHDNDITAEYQGQVIIDEPSGPSYCHPHTDYSDNPDSRDWRPSEDNNNYYIQSHNFSLSGSGSGSVQPPQ